MLHGTLAAALTPLRDGGARLDEDAFGPYCNFLAGADLDGLLAFGTNGEGVLFSVDERTRGVRLFAEAAAGRLQIAAHCGAQTTADTVALAAAAAEAGADAVAVIGPPYFPLDETSLFNHFTAAAAACAPTPFYVYEFERTSGYAVPLAVVERLRETAPNLAGLKVSDAPFDKVSPYIVEGLDVFIGAESLIGAGLAAGAAGAVSGLASAFPEVVVEAVRSGDSARAGGLREIVERFPRLAALKAIVGARGVPLRGDMRAPLRPLTDDERASALAAVAAYL